MCFYFTHSFIVFVTTPWLPHHWNFLYIFFVFSRTTFMIENFSLGVLFYIKLSVVRQQNCIHLITSHYFKTKTVGKFYCREPQSFEFCVDKAPLLKLFLCQTENKEFVYKKSYWWGSRCGSKDYYLMNLIIRLLFSFHCLWFK